MSSYDKQRAHYAQHWAHQKAKTAMVVMTCVIVVCTIVTSMIVPWLKYAELRRIEVKKAIRYLSSDVCTNPVLRADLENYNMCEQSARTAASSPVMGAFYDVMSDFSLCSGGRCTLLATNVTYILPILFFIVIVVVAIIGACSCAHLFMSSWRYNMTQMQLPLHSASDWNVPGRIQIMSMSPDDAMQKMK